MQSDTLNLLKRTTYLIASMDKDKVMSTTLRIPPVFYFDHLARECGKSGKIIRSAKSYLIVELDDTALDDLMSDASYYIECADSFDPGMRGLVASAKATLRALKAVSE